MCLVVIYLFIYATIRPAAGRNPPADSPGAGAGPGPWFRQELLSATGVTGEI